jgi:orotate phosphoribosyltransferase
MTDSFPRHAALARFVLERAIRRGSFTLASGRTARYYCDGKMVTLDPEGAGLVAAAMFEELEPIAFDALGGMDMGATPIVSVVAEYALRHGRRFPAFVVRKESKGHGTKKQIEGPIPGEPSRVVIIDDVITSGGSIEKAIVVAREAGHEVVAASCVLDRGGGGAALMERLGVAYVPLLRASELGLEDGG